MVLLAPFLSITVNDCGFGNSVGICVLYATLFASRYFALKLEIATYVAGNVSSLNVSNSDESNLALIALSIADLSDVLFKYSELASVSVKYSEGIVAAVK